MFVVFGYSRKVGQWFLVTASAMLYFAEEAMQSRSAQFDHMATVGPGCTWQGVFDADPVPELRETIARLTGAHLRGFNVAVSPAFPSTMDGWTGHKARCVLCQRLTGGAARCELCEAEAT